MMHISPLSLWNKPNIVFKSNSSADKTFFSPILPFQLSSNKRSWLLLLDDSTDTFLETPALLLSSHCCSLSFVKAAAENSVCRKDMLPGIYSQITAQLSFSSMDPFSLLQLALDNASVQISSLKAKMIYIFRDQTPPSLKTLFSVYTVISGTFPPVTINYMPLSIIRLILLILATKSKKH